MINLTYNSASLLPQANIYMLEQKSEAPTISDTDIYGNQVIITPEIMAAQPQWSIAAAYVALSVVQACETAYTQHQALVLTDEVGNSFNMVVVAFPTVTRYKQVDGSVTYTVQLLLGSAPSTWQVSVVSLSGPRLFGR